METIKLKDEFIKLGQALKAVGFCESGVEAKFAVLDGVVTVNGETETRRGRKLYDGDVIEYEGKQVRIEGAKDDH
ncbi:MAG: RNA-binding S4 domain-containing protein [Lachnospiraceae bacterium]|nr:RNA-binding S4 domain-containing protein [Lachnospiraceae bacterium]